MKEKEGGPPALGGVCATLDDDEDDCAMFARA